MSLKLIILGEFARAEFAPVRQAIDELCAGAHRQERGASDLQQGMGCADLWIVCQSWPDEFAPSTIRRIIDAGAASRLICAYGAWCASDGRTRDVWPPAVRVPIGEFHRRLAFELEVVAGRRAPLPLTAARDEQFAARVHAAPERPDPARRTDTCRD